MINCYLFAFFFSLFLSLLFTPRIIKLAFKFKVLDKPSRRRVKYRPLPRWGGLAIYLSFMGTLLACYLLSGSFRLLITHRYAFIGKYLIGILVGGTIIVILGLIDDKKNISPTTKLLGQIIAGLIILEYEVKISELKIPFFANYLSFPILLGIIVTLFWILIFVNSINLIDGLDGLAAGIVCLASISFFIVSLIQVASQQSVVTIKSLKLTAVLTAILSGSCLGFLKYNFYPAKIYMGDTGSMFLGFILGSAAIIGTLKTTAAISLIIPIIIIGLPILDTIFAIVRRWIFKKSILAADRGHFHHFLVYAGLKQSQAVLVLYSVSACFCLVAIFLISG